MTTRHHHPRKAIHPDLTTVRWLPRFSYGPRLTRLSRRMPPRPRRSGPGVRIEELLVPGPPGGPDVTLRMFRPTTPAAVAAPVPALFWIHGGGLIFGSAEQDDRSNIGFVHELGIAVAAVRYRFAPEHPAPAAVEDAYAGLVGLTDAADRLGIDPTRIAIGGASAGGGLTAALALLAHDRGRVRPRFQLMVYPMLDDRTVVRTDLDLRHVRVWTAQSNRYGWTSYLGREPGGADVSPYAAAARREDLSGLPPAWIGVGSLDLFHDEDVTYAARLTEAAVDCELSVVPGAFHGFDALFPNAPVSRDFWHRQADALRRNLFP